MTLNTTLESIRGNMRGCSWVLQDVSTLLDHNAEDLRVLEDYKSITSKELIIKAEKLTTYKNSLLSMVNNIEVCEGLLLDLAEYMGDKEV